MNIQNALTVDVEDYFHVSAFAKNIKPSDWENQPLRVEKNTQRLMDLFDEAQVKATFFVLGWVADRNRSLIKEIADRGHEVACHGYSHQLIYNQSEDIFREETLRSKSLLEDIAQQPVRGYRAASYSITNKSLWALDILVEAGFEYDSSIFPVRHDRYGIPGSECRDRARLRDRADRTGRQQRAGAGLHRISHHRRHQHCHLVATAQSRHDRGHFYPVDATEPDTL